MSQADCVIGGLSNPSKMPGKSFGFSATKCITGSRLRQVPGSVCSDCYACKGMYLFPTVKAAHARRYRKLMQALNNPIYREQYISAFTRLISRQRVPYFRWHDSGDLQSVEHLALICEIAKQTPMVRHWLPTREYRIVKNYLSGATLPANLNVRLSAHMVGEVIPHPLPECTTSAVYEKDPPGYACPSRNQGNQCRECRACWDKTVPLVTYELH